MWSIKHRNFPDAGNGIAAELCSSQIDRDRHRVVSAVWSWLYPTCYVAHPFRHDSGEIDEEHLLSVMAHNVRAMANRGYHLIPLSAGGIIQHRFAWPSSGDVVRRPHQKREALQRVRILDLLVEFKDFSWGISAYVKHDQIVELRLPVKSCPGEFLNFMHLDPVISEIERQGLFCSSASHCSGMYQALEEESSKIKNKSFQPRNEAALNFVSLRSLVHYGGRSGCQGSR
jgi:hypothetical protein